MKQLGLLSMLLGAIGVESFVPHAEVHDLLQAGSTGQRFEHHLHLRRADNTLTYALIGGGVFLVVAAGVGGFMYMRKGQNEGKEGDVVEEVAQGRPEARAAAAADVEAPRTAAESEKAAAKVNEDVDFERLLKLVAKRTAQQVGPKLAKAHAVRGVLVNRVLGLRSQVTQFVMDEMMSTFGMVLREAGAEEFMLLLDPSASAAANLPPSSILLAGLLSPVVLTASLIIHLSQVIMVLLPTLIMCIWAIYVDRNTLDSCAVPTIWSWVFVQGGIALILTVAHLSVTMSIQQGKASIQAKIDGMQDRLREAVSDGELSIDEIRELFLIVSILLEHSLIVEDALRRSIWRKVIGYGTIAWMLTTLWTFILVLGWTFVPGQIAFHAAAASVAGGAYCGAWATVFTARLSCVLSLLFLMFNMLSVLQFISDQLVVSESYSAAVISKARRFDNSMLGIPVVETFVKAFLLRGTADTIKAQIAVSRGESSALEAQRDELQHKVDALDRRINLYRAEAEVLKTELGLATDEPDGAKETEESEAIRAKALEQATKQEIDQIYQKIVDAANKIRDSSMEAFVQAQDAAAAGAEAAAAAASSAAEQAAAGFETAQKSAQEGLAHASQLAQEAAAQASDAASKLKG